MRSSVDEAQKPVNELAILSPSEVQEFRQQVAQELAEEERKKSMSKEHFGPRAVRSGSLVKRGGSTVHTERPAVKIRPSLAPSFVGASSPPRSEPRTSPPRPTNESTASLSSATSGYTTSQGSPFRRGHRRIPTAIRNVPSIHLTESADDESESEYSRAETPCSERVMSPPPMSRLMEPGRQLPTWVPDDNGSSAEEDDADVDEPTVTIQSPPKIKRKPSKVLAQHDTTPKPSTEGLYEQFVKATPQVARRSHIIMPSLASNAVRTEPVIFERDDMRTDSRATNHTTRSRTGSIISSLFSRPSSRASTLSFAPSSVADTEDGEKDAGEKKKGRFRRAMKKLLR